jgi:hypothetical protein
MTGNASRLTRTATVLFAIAALALTGCVDSSDDAAPASSPTAASSTTPSPTPTSTPAPSEAPAATPVEAEPVSAEDPAEVPAEAMTVAQLHELYVAAGLPCTLEMDVPYSDGEIEQGHCVEDDTMGFFVYASNADVDKLLHSHEDHYEPGTFLVGDRWLVQASGFTDNLTPAQTTLGGKIWTHDAPFYSGE